jgi:hypothetical protein
VTPTPLRGIIHANPGATAVAFATASRHYHQQYQQHQRHYRDGKGKG